MQVAGEVADAKTNPLRAKKMYVLAALLVSLESLILAISTLCIVERRSVDKLQRKNTNLRGQTPTRALVSEHLLSHFTVRYRYFALPLCVSDTLRYRCCALLVCYHLYVLLVGGKLP